MLKTRRLLQAQAFALLTEANRNGAVLACVAHARLRGEVHLYLGDVTLDLLEWSVFLSGGQWSFK